jgi:myo-inositol-1(or 4)-monophosphatase
VANEIRSKVINNIDSSGAGEKVYVGADGDSTYRIDDIAEKAALQTLGDESVAVLSEEAGLVFLDDDPDYICVLDPLDGSKNAVSGIPFYCTSIALAPMSENPSLQDINIGVVMNLVTGDLFTGERGKGTCLNDKLIKTSSKTSPGDIISSLYLRSGYDIISSFPKVRAMGAVALELAHVASGGIGCLLDNRGYLKVTDVAAGKVLVEEAGGVVTDFEGNDLNQSIERLERVSILAAGNARLHTRILGEVR